MLHWFAGQKATENPNDPDATGFEEAPETPAPVFAVRAFKHAIFGTPQTNQPKPRRHSNTENARPKNVDSKPSRPGMSRPKSTNDAHTLAKQDSQSLEEPLASPTKGILLTPGAAAARKKNVTFGEQVVDNEEKRPLKSGLPDDCPGKWASPWSGDGEEGKKREDSPDKGRGRSKLTEAFEQVRDESRKRKSKGDKTGKDDGNELKPELAEPRSESGKYWKREYDIYRTNTQREVKKLITKQKSAKSYAQMKDSQCTDLSDQLRQEQKRVETLGAKTTELASQVKELQDKLRASQDAEKRYQDEIATLKRQLGRSDTTKPENTHPLPAVPQEQDEPAQRLRRERTKSQEDPRSRIGEPDKLFVEESKRKDDPVQRPSEPYNASAVEESRKSIARSYRARGKTMDDDLQLKPTDDIWAQLDSSSNPVVAQNIDKPISTTKGGFDITSDAHATPLKALNLNTLPVDNKARRRSSPQSMDVECKSTPDLERVDSKNSQQAEDGRHDSPLISSALLISSPELPAGGKPAQTHGNKQHNENEDRHASPPRRVKESSPFQISAKALPSKPAVSESDSALEGATRAAVIHKENISPTSKSQTPQHDLKVKPSAMWNSINASPASKRNSSLTGKDGRQLSQDRIEAARARIAARGRVTS